MTTLADLASRLLPGARQVQGLAAVTADDLDVGWVRVMRARVPAFDALEAGDLVIVPAAALAVVAPGPDERGTLVEACRTARASGVLLVDGDSGPAGEPAGPGVLDELADALVAAGLPVVRIPRADAAALERTVIGFLLSETAELERQATLLESRLENLALEGGGPAALVGAVAGFLGRAIALEGRRGDPLAVHAPSDVPDAAVAVARYYARPRQAVALRMPLPAPGGAAGSLVLLGDRAPSDLERASLGRIAGFLALELARDEAVRRARDQARRGEALPAGGPPWVVLLARQRVPGASDDAPEAHEHREAIRRELRLIAPARRLALRGDADSLEIRAVLAVDPPGGSEPEGLAVAGRIAAFLDRTVAVSRPFAAVGDRPAAEGEARATLEAAEVLPGAPGVARASRLPAYRLLGAVHNLADGERLARALLEPLLASRADVRKEHLATLRAILDGGGVSEAAVALGVHRNTVAYRLRRIEQLTGWRLAEPEIRLALAIGLRVVHDA
jgi:purine catabolism regulator